MKIKYLSKRLLQIVPVFLFILTPLISAVLFCLKDGRTISDLYIPLGGWSDEITYYKQIEGILSHGMPRGFFGYNQSRALYGPLGVWGLIPLIPYVIWGFFFGWNYCSPIYANIFLSTIAFLGISVILRPKNKWMGAFSLFWIVNPLLNRYVISGVVEASVLSQLLLVTACGIYLLSDSLRKQTNRIFTPSKDRIVLLLCTALICILALARPYYAVFFLIPLWKAVRDKRKIWMITLPLTAVAVMILFFLNNHFFCSTYFNNILSFDSIQEAGLSGVFAQIFHSIIEIARLIWYALRYKGVGVGWYYLLLGAELLIMLAVCIRRKCCRKAIPPMYPIVLIGNSLILLSIIVMYDLGVGARHILSLLVANALILIIETHFSISGMLSVICLFSILQTGNADAPPYRDKEYAAYMDELEDRFSSLIRVSDTLSYDNVVAMPMADHSAANPEQSVSTYYGLLFAMPSGVGISLDYEDFYEKPESRNAGYLLVHPQGQIRHKLEQDGMRCLYENDELALYGH